MDLPDQRHPAGILSKPAGHSDDGLFSRQDTSSSSISPFSSSLGADDLPGSANNFFTLNCKLSFILVVIFIATVLWIDIVGWQEANLKKEICCSTPNRIPV